MGDERFLCVDGGGTKTEALLCDTAGHVLGRGISTGSNALSVGIGQATEAVMDAVRQAARGFPIGEITAGYLFIPGFSQCLPLPLPFPIHAYSDAENAYFGALGAPGGIVVLAGTGSFAVSIAPDGVMTSVGGWGPMLGDEGSGYDIGRRAVIKTLEHFDQGKSPTWFEREVLAHYGIEHAENLVHVIYHGECDREKMAGLCPVVGRAARAGDPDALAVLGEACRGMVGLARTLAERLHVSSPPVSLTGGVTQLGEILLEPLARMLADAGLAYVKPLYNPGVGGVLYGYLQMMGRQAEETLARSYYADYLLFKEDERHANGCVF